MNSFYEMPKKNNTQYLIKHCIVLKKHLFTLLGICLFFGTAHSEPTFSIFNGVADNSTCNKVALDAALAATDTLFIPQGSDYYKCTATVTVPAGKTLIFENGAKLNVTGNLKGNQTRIVATETEIFNSLSNISGTWVTDTLCSAWTNTIGDGVVDDYTALNLFFTLIDITSCDEAKLGTEKNYYISKQIIKTINREVNLNGNGSRIFRKYADLASNECILSLTGATAYSDKVVSSNLIGGQMSLTVNDASGLQPGMGIELISNELYGKEDMDGGKWHFHYKGLLSKIVSISGNTLFMADTIPYNFDASKINTLKFFIVLPVTIKNVQFSSENITGTKQMSQLRISKLFDVFIENINCTPLGYSGISASSIYNGYYNNITLMAPTTGGDDYTFGVYGIVPSLHVNCIFENIYGRATTHGIAFTNSPSYNVVVKNSNLKAYNNSSNGADSHASHWLKFENCTIYGFQGNWGTFIFDNCDMYSCEGNTVFNEREGSSRGGPNAIFTNCDIYTPAGTSARTIIYRYNSDDTCTNTGQYTLINNTFHLENSRSYLIRSASIGGAVEIKPVRIEGNTFVGNGTLYLPTHISTNPTNRGGVFTFKNNAYSKINWTSPPLDQFQTINIDGNTPVNESTSDFIVNWNEKAGNVNFTNNVFVGTNFWIIGCTGNLLFNNNQIKSKNGTGYKNRNYICNNGNLVFTNNNLIDNQWTLTGNLIVEANLYNGLEQPIMPSGNWLDIKTPGQTIETGITMEGTSNFTIISWAKMDDITTNAVQYLVGSSVSKLYLGFNPVSTGPLFKGSIRNVNGTISSPSLSRFYMDNKWHTYVFVMENGILKGYVDGIALLSYDASAIYSQMYASGTIQIGGANNTNLWQGPVKSFIIYNRALSLTESNLVTENPEVTLTGEIYKLINHDISGPQGYWAFNESSSNSAADSSEYNNPGNLINGPIWHTGVFGNALQFDGINDYVNCGKDTELDMGTSDFSIASWIKMKSNQVSFPTIISKGGSSNSVAGYWLYVTNAGLKFVIGDGTSRISASSTVVNLFDDKWHHVVVTLDRDGSASFYIDGVMNNSVSISGFSEKNIINTAKSLTIGSVETSYSTMMNGKIDEVRIYKRILEQAEITLFATPNEEEVENILSHWAFDENSGNTTADSSGNGLNGTLLNDPVWTGGIKGNAIKFDGINDKVDFGTNSTLELGTNDMSIAAWVKMDANQLSYPTIVSKGGTSSTNAGYWFYVTNSCLKIVLGDGTSRISASSASVPVLDGEWHHVSVTIDRDANATFYFDGDPINSADISSFNSKNILNASKSLTVGSAASSSTSYLKGTIDDVKLYAEVLTAQKIDSLADIDVETITAYLAMNEENGDLAPDSTNNGHDGMLINGPAWKEGLFGNAVFMDGKDDKIDCGNDSQLDLSAGDFSISTWVNLTPTQSGNCTFISKGGFTKNNEGYLLSLYNRKLKFNVSNGTELFSYYSDEIFITDNIWHHIAVTVKRDGNVTFYLDSENIGTFSAANFYGVVIENENESLLLGTAGYRSTYMRGYIDEFRLYKHELNPDEILQLAYVPQENDFKLDLNEPSDLTEIEVSVYPNPFVSNAIIKFLNDSDQNLQADIYDIKGVRVASLFSGFLKSGENMLYWDGNDLNGNEVSRGIYMVMIVNETKVMSETIIKMN